MANIVIVEDNQEIRDGWTLLINTIGKHRVISSFEDCESFLNNLSQLDVDMVLMDIDLPGIDGIQGTIEAKKDKPEIDIIIVTVFEESNQVFEALCAGATGYLTKNLTHQELIAAIDQCIAGGAPMSSRIARMVVNSFQKRIESPLSIREGEILKLLANGKSYKSISEQLFISKNTTKTHIKNIYQKLNVNSQTQAIKKARDDKII